MFRESNTRALVFQVCGVAVVLGAIGVASVTAWHRLQAQGLTSGFGILFQPTRWTIESPFLNQSADDPYWWTILVALVNTIAVSLLGIIFSTATGFAVGVGRVSRSRVVSRACGFYVEIFRNIPLVLQVVFWYVTATSLPSPRSHPPSLFGIIFLTNKGVFLPSVGTKSGDGLIVMLFAIVVLLLVLVPLAIRRMGHEMPWRRVAVPTAILLVCATLYVALSGSPLMVSSPQLAGFSFTGGGFIPIEIIVLTFAIVIFSAAYVAEIVRGGLLSVPKGQIEAALAVGLPNWVVFLKVQLPIALRSMIPPLGNQFIFVIKATALGIAVGYSDIFSVSVVSISQTGQSIEFLVVMMVAYFILNYGTTLLVGWWDRALAFRRVTR